MEILLLAICLFIMFLIYVYAENKLLIIRKYKLKLCRNVKQSFRIVQISDIHKKRDEKRIAAKVRQLKPDIILLTGDLVSRSEKDFSHLEFLISSVSDICPAYACPGNHEQDLSEEQYDIYKKIMDKYGVNYFENRMEFLKKNGLAANIAGITLKKGIYKNEKGGYSNLQKFTSEELKSALGAKEGFTILLAHNPLCAKAYAEWGADMVFCGHVHGGVVRLPFLGGILSPERKFFPKYSKGLYEIGETKMIVSGGIGKLRVFNPPEIVCCDVEY